MGKDTELPGPLQEHHSPSTSMCSSIQKLPKPHTTGIFMEASSLMQDSSRRQVPAHLPFLEDEDGAKSSKLLVVAWSSWYLVPIQEPTKHCFIRTRDVLILITQEMTRVLRALCQEPGAEAKVYFSYGFTLSCCCCSVARLYLILS